MIVVKVRDRDIKAAPMGPVTTGSVGLPVSWHFSEEWDDLAKTAVFRVGNDGTEITVAVLEDLCLVPDELLVQANAGENLWIGVYGWKGTNANDTIVPEIAMPTIWTYTRIQDGSQPSGIEPPEGTPGWSAQIQNATDEALRVAHGVAADAAEGDFDGISPAVTISSITHGHSVTITDRDHPTGQSFNVMDGDSAYEQAVAGGYTGTEAQFNEELASFKELSDETKEAAPFYAEYGVTTKAAVVAAINGKRQVYVSGTLGMDYAPLVGTFLYTPLFGEELQTGYRFAIVEGTTQYIYDLADEWSSSTNDLSAPADRAEAAATAADGSAKDSEAYAIGKRGGTDVGSSDPAYHNNSKYYAEQAGETVNTFTGTTVPAAVQTVNTAGQTQVGAVNTAGQTALTAVSGAQTAAVSAVQTESATQQAAIQQKGEDVLDSIPSDYTDLSEDVDDLKSHVTLYTGNAQINFVKDKYIVTSGDTVDITSPVNSSTGYGYAVIDCAEGDKFTVTSSGGTNPRAWCFIDASGNSLTKAGAGVAANNTVITAPANTAKLVINAKYATEKSYLGELLKTAVDRINSAFDGYCNLDFSDIVDAYPSSSTIGDRVNFTSSTISKTIKKITQVKRGYIYRISVIEGDTLASTSGRKTLVLADSEEIIFQNDIYFLTAGQTDVIEFTAFGDGYLYLEVDKNYKSVLIEGSSVFQAQKVSEAADYKVTYLAETGRLIVIRESIRANRYATKHFDLPAGTYHFHCDSVVSTDTDSTVCLVNLGGGSTTFKVNRGVAIDVDVVLPNNSTTQYFYASDGSSHSSGDNVAYNNVIISKAAYSPIGNALIDENSAWTD